MVFEQSAISNFTVGACPSGPSPRLNPAAHGLRIRTEAVGDLPDGKPLPTKAARLDYAAVIDFHATSVGAAEAARALACGFAGDQHPGLARQTLTVLFVAVNRLRQLQPHEPD